MIHVHHQPFTIARITSVTFEGLIGMVIHHSNTSSRGAVVVVSTMKRKTGAKDRTVLFVPAICNLCAINVSVRSCLSDSKGARRS